MTSQHLTGTTQSMTARTTSTAAHGHHQPSARALAARSWSAVRRLDGEERAEATARHFERFVPLGAACRR